MSTVFLRILSLALTFLIFNSKNSVAQALIETTPVDLGVENSNITSLRFIKGSHKLVYTTTSNDITILDVATKSRDTWQSKFVVDQIEISENGKYIAVSGKKNITVFETGTHEIIMERSDLDGPRLFHIDPASSNILIYTVEPKKLMHHNLATGDRMQIKTVNALVHMIYHTSGEFLVVGTKKETYSVNLKTGNTKAFYKQNQKGESNLERLGLWDDHTRPLAFIDSGRFLVTRPYGNFNSYLTIFESISGEIEENFNVDYQSNLFQNLSPVGFSDTKSALLVPTHVSSPSSQYDVALNIFTGKRYKSKVNLRTYSFKKKPKGGAKVYYDISSSGSFVATYCASCTNPTLEVLKIEW